MKTAHELNTVKAKLAAVNAERDKLRAAAATRADRIKALEDQLTEGQATQARLVDQLEELSKENERLRKAAEERAHLEAEAAVDAVIGTKIVPAAREKWLAVRLRSKAEFDDLMNEMPDLPYFKTIVPHGARGVAPGAGGKSLIDEAKS